MGKWVTVNAKFRAYHTLAESCDDHARHIATFKRDGKLVYAKAMSHAGDARAFAGALEGVYATDSHYAEKLWEMMDEHRLERFDDA